MEILFYFQIRMNITISNFWKFVHDTWSLYCPSQPPLHYFCTILLSLSPSIHPSIHPFLSLPLPPSLLISLTLSPLSLLIPHDFILSPISAPKCPLLSLSPLSLPLFILTSELTSLSILISVSIYIYVYPYICIYIYEILECRWLQPPLCYLISHLSWFSIQFWQPDFLPRHCPRASSVPPTKVKKHHKENAEDNMKKKNKEYSRIKYYLFEFFTSLAISMNDSIILIWVLM